MAIRHLLLRILYIWIRGLDEHDLKKLGRSRVGE
jgi:hypothetical protein